LANRDILDQSINNLLKSSAAGDFIMTYEPDIQQIKKEILERAIYQYETRIADLKNQIDHYELSVQR